MVQRISNLKTESLSKIKAGDWRFFKEVLGGELEATSEEILEFPIEKVEELRGRAKLLKVLLEIIPT
jgi:hypothetical protein